MVCELLERKPFLKMRDLSQSKIKAFSEQKLVHSPGLIMWKIGYFVKSEAKAWIPSEIKWYSTHEEVLKEY